VYDHGLVTIANRGVPLDCRTRATLPTFLSVVSIGVRYKPSI